MRIAGSARRHGINDDQIRHALAQAVSVYDLDAGFTMIIGPDASSALIEVGLVDTPTGHLVVHAMPARSRFR